MSRRGVAMLSLVAVVVFAGCRTASVGAVLGDPTGLAVRSVLEGDRTLNVAIGIHALDSKFAYGHVDYVMYPNRVRREDWNPYWGIGAGYLARLDDAGSDGSDGNVGAALRVPLGLSYDSSGWDFFVQLAVYVGSGLGGSGAIGLRLSL